MEATDIARFVLHQLMGIEHGKQGMGMEFFGAVTGRPIALCILTLTGWLRTFLCFASHERLTSRSIRMVRYFGWDGKGGLVQFGTWPAYSFPVIQLAQLYV